MIFVVDLLDHPGRIELEATAIVPDRRPRAARAARRRTPKRRQR
jgi:hypothetical protein